MAKGHTWELGDEVKPWMVEKVILPLIQRGYLSYSDLGIDAETQKWIRNAGTDDKVKLISQSAGTSPIHSSLMGDAQKHAKLMRQGEAGPAEFVPGGAMGSELSAHSRIMGALQRFQQDNGILQFKDDPNYKIGGGRVGIRTLTALNPQVPTLDVQQLQQEQDKIATRQKFAAEANPEVAANLTQMKHFYNWVPAKTLTALAFEGYSINDDFTQQVARLAMNDRASPWWKKNADRIAQLDHEATLADVNPKAFEADGKGGVKVKPFAPASQVVGSSGGGLLDGLGFVGDAVKGAARWTDATLSAPMEFAQGGMRDAVSGVMNAPNSVQNLNAAINPNLGNAATAGNMGALTSQGYVDPAAQTRLGQALSGAGMGSGFFAQGQAQQRQTQAAQAALSVYGHAATPGRLVAAGANEVLSPMGINVIEPGSVGYTVLSGLTDFGVQTYGDPSNIALEGIGNARRGASVISATERVAGLEKTGLIPAVRRTFNPMTAMQTLEAPRGKQFLRWATETNDNGEQVRTFDEIWKQVKDVPTARRLTDATTEQEAKSVMSDVLGTTLRDRVYAPPTADLKTGLMHPFQSIGYSFSNFVDPARLLGNTRPGPFIDVNDANQAVTQIDRTIRNVSTAFHQIDHTVEFDGVRMPATEAMARASEAGRPAMLDVTRKVMGNIADGLIARGVDEVTAKDMTTLMVKRFEDTRGYLLEEVARHSDDGWETWLRSVDPGYAKLDMHGQALPTPAALVDLLQNAIPLPSSRALKRLTSWAEKVPGLKGGIPQTVADSIMNDVYKPLALLRVATMVRIISEEQLRIAADGFISFTNHPSRALALVSGAPTRAGRKPLSNEVGVLAGGLFDESFAYSAAQDAVAGRDPSAWLAAMNGGYAHIIDVAEPSRRWAGKTIIKRLADDGSGLHPDFLDAWGERLFHYTQDPVWRYAAQHTPEETKAWFKNGKGRQYLDFMRGSTTRAPGEIPLKPAGFDLSRPEDADRFIDTTYKSIADLTGSDTDLGHLLLKGNKILDGDGNEVHLFRMKSRKGLAKAGRDEKKPIGLTPEARAVLEEKALKDVGPQAVFGDLHQIDPEKKRILDEFIRSGFSMLYERPTNRLSRSPYFRQRYWERVAELTPYADPETAKRIVKEAERQGMFNETRADRFSHMLHGEPGQPMTLENMQRQAAKAASVENKLSMKEIDQLAKGHALDKTKGLLYDLTERSQFFDSLRLMFPFGEAWKEVTTRWLRLVKENPRVIRRFDQVMTEGKRSGFFYTDPTSGEEVFNYPGSQLFNKTVTGVDVPITSQLNGLNIVGNGLPGVGWGVQIPMQFVMKTMPSLDNSPIGDIYRDYVAPFGDTSGGDPIGVSVSAALPPWIDRLRELTGDPAMARQHANTIAHVEQYLMTSGEYGSPSKGFTEAQMRRIRTDAGKAANALTFIRMIGSFGLPAAPNFQWQVMDKDGKLAMTGALQTELRSLYDDEKAGKVQSADAEFVKRHGLDVYATMTPFTLSTSTGLPVTEKGAEWVRANSGIRSKYPSVYGLFAPPDPDGQFDQRLYESQINKGERKSVTVNAAVWQRMANDKVAQFLYDKSSKQVNDAFSDGDVPTPIRTALTKYRRQLAKQFPGYGEDFTDAGKRDFPNTVAELKRAANDPALRDSQQAKAIRAYLKQRDEVGEAYATQSTTEYTEGWVESKDWAPIRVAMNAYQQQLKKKYPQSAPVFDLLFRKDGEV